MEPPPKSVSSLPSKQILTSILTSLDSCQPQQAPKAPSLSQTNTLLPQSSPLRSIKDEDETKAKAALLTLHFLFPHELLPALDLIDRQLITHLYTTTSRTNHTVAESEPSNEGRTEDLPGIQTQVRSPNLNLEIYYVQSASSSNSTDAQTGRKAGGGRFRNALANSSKTLFYEVHLDSWNCTCPAFAYSALRLFLRQPTAVPAGSLRQDIPGVGGEYEWMAGGVATREGSAVPVCKHILAVTLTKAAPGLFGAGVTSREVEREELAGWAAGWGEH